MSKSKKQQRKGIKRGKSKASTVEWLKLIQQVMTAFFILTLPVLIYTSNSEYGYTKIIYAYFMITILYSLWGVQAWLENHLTFWRPALFWPALAIIVAGILSMINASSPGIVLQSLAVLIYFILFYFYIANTTTRKTFYLYLGMGSLSALFVALYGVLQYYALLPGLTNRGAEFDMLSSFGNKNFLAEYLNIWIIAFLVLLLRFRLVWAKVLVLATTLISIIAFINADSTGALIGILAGVFFFGIGFIVFKKPTIHVFKQRRAWVWVGIWGMVVLASLFLADRPGLVGEFLTREPAQSEVFAFQNTIKAKTVFQNPIDQIKAVIDRYWEEGSGNTRAWDWWVAYEMWRANPIFGVGVGHYKVQFLKYKIDFLATERGQQYDFYIPRAAQAHNDYFQTAAEMGSVGIAAMLFFMAMLFWKTIQQVRSVKGSQKWVTLALYAGVVAFFIDSMVNFPGRLPASSFSMLLLLGMLHSNYLFPKLKTFQLNKTSVKIAVSVFLVCTLTVTTFAYRDWQANIHLDAGINHLSNARYQLALGEFEKSLVLDFQPAEVLFRLGAVHQALGDPDKAAEYFESSMDSYLVDEVFLPLAVYKLNNEQYAEARDLLDRLSRSKPREALREEVDLFRAVIEVRDDNLTQGIEMLKTLIEKSPSFERAYYTLGDAFLANNDCPSALVQYEKALDASTRRRDSFQQRLGDFQGKTVLANAYSRVLISLERYKGLTDEIQAKVDIVRRQCG